MFTKHQAPIKTATINVAAVFAEHEAARKKKPTTDTIAHPLAVASIALTMVLMSYSTLVPVVPILVFFVMWLPYLVTKSSIVWRPSLALVALFTIPLLCVISTLWSDYPPITLYFGTAFVVLALCILAIARVVAFESLIAGLVLGISITLLITLLDGTRITNQISGSRALIGLFGSKNMVGFTAEIGIIAALIYGLMLRGLWRKICFALPAFILAATCLILSHSGTAILTLAGALIVLGAALAIGKCPAPIRGLVMLGTIIAITALAAGIVYLTSSADFLAAFGKDSTLTGRTYLWQQGMEIAQERPLLGHGYSAFWVHGQPLAERYWQEFYIASRTGFHFHNTWIQAWVDLGYVGAALITLIILANCVLSLRQLLRFGAMPEVLLLLSLSFMFLMRAFVEIDFFLGPFGVGTVLFYCIIPRLMQMKPVNRQ